VPKLGCRPATSSPVNISLTWTLSGALDADVLLNATEEAFDKAGLLPPGTCGSGQLKPIEVAIGAGNITSRRLSVASSVDVNLVYQHDQEAMLTKVKAGGSTLQTDLQAAFLQALADAGDSSTTVTLYVGKIVVDEAGATTTAGPGATTTGNTGVTGAAKDIGGLSVAFVALTITMAMAHF